MNEFLCMRCFTSLQIEPAGRTIANPPIVTPHASGLTHVTRRSRLTVALLSAFVATLVLAGVHLCADGGAMAGAYRTCDCRGWEWALYDRTEADGPRRTLCLGFIRSRTCYQSRGGPVVPCAISAR